MQIVIGSVRAGCTRGVVVAALVHGLELLPCEPPVAVLVHFPDHVLDLHLSKRMCKSSSVCGLSQQAPTPPPSPPPPPPHTHKDNWCAHACALLCDGADARARQQIHRIGQPLAAMGDQVDLICQSTGHMSLVSRTVMPTRNTIHDLRSTTRLRRM